MDDDVDVGDQRVDGVAVKDVALPVLGLGPSLVGRVKRPAGHSDDPVYVGVSVESAHRRYADVARGPRDCDCPPHTRMDARCRCLETPGAQLSARACFAAL